MQRNKFLRRLLVLICVCSLFTACSSTKVTTTKKDDADSSGSKTEVTEAPKATDAPEEAADTSQEDTDAAEENSEGEIYGLGDLITVSQDGKEMYKLSIDSVTTTDERNEYAETDPEQVVTIGYSYWNVGSEEDVYISDYDFKVIDADKNVCDTYPATISNYATNAPLGTKCYAESSFGLAKASDTIQLHFYDNIFSTSSDIIFDLPTDTVSEEKHDDAVTYAPPTDCYKVGESIKVSGESGEYTITINSAKKVKERNEYAGQDAEAVWLLDYTYENTGYDEDLYVSDTQCVVVDQNGEIGSTYPGDVTKYPDYAPKGTKCTAQMCFGTKSDTDTIYLYFYDNMFNTKADMVVEVKAK